MAPSVISPEVDDVELHVKSGQTTKSQDSLAAAKQRFVQRNPTSLKLHEESIKSLPGGNTRSLLHTAPFPVFLKNGKGYQVTSEDGHTYTDFVGELTAGLYGHSQPQIQAALISTIQNIGLNLGGTTRFESLYASLLCTRFHLDRIRFTNSGTEANMHAILGAKHYTGKSKIVVFTAGYHGACFMFPDDKPAPNTINHEDWIIAEYNSIPGVVAKIEDRNDIAAVLVEGMQGSGPCLPGHTEFLHQIQTSARKVGAVFILDEVMTSRLAPGGLQELEGLEPDITTFGKYLGGGITFGAFGGKEEIMKVYDPREKGALAHSGTFNNNTLGMVAGFTGLSEVYTPDVAREFNEMGDRFRELLRGISRGTKMTVTGRGSLIGVHFLKDGRKELNSFGDRDEDAELKELFWLEMMEEGFWNAKRGNISLILGTPWGELERFAESVRGFLEKYKELVRV